MHRQEASRGAPDVQCAKGVYKRVIKQGQVDKAKALESVVCHNNWPLAKIYLKDPAKATCPRCGLGPETGEHRYWTCIKNVDITDPDVSDNNCFKLEDVGSVENFL